RISSPRLCGASKGRNPPRLRTPRLRQITAIWGHWKSQGEVARRPYADRGEVKRGRGASWQSELRVPQLLEGDAAVEGGLAREAEHLLADDVALDLVGAAADVDGGSAEERRLPVTCERGVRA